MQQHLIRSLQIAFLRRRPLVSHRPVSSPAVTTTCTSENISFGSTRRSYSFKALLNDMNNVPDHKQSAMPTKGSSEVVRNKYSQKRSNQHKQGYNNFDSAHRNQSISNKFFVDLERQTVEHLNSFPSGDADSTSLSKWQKTTVPLVMEWSKLWGKRRANNSITPQQIAHGVSLANDLMLKVLDLTKCELERALGVSKPSEERMVPHLVREHPQSKQKVLDTEICCQMIALGWSRCDLKLTPHNPALKAQAILDRLEEMCQMYDQLSKSKARKLSVSRLEITPTGRLYNHVLSCWSRSSDPKAEDCARKLLNRMAANEAYSSPDLISYNNMLNLYANRGDVGKAEALLRQMEDPSNQSLSLSSHVFPRNKKIKPDVFSYSIIINAIRKRFTSNHDMNDPARAEKIVTDMIKAGITPNEVCFSTVLSMYTSADRILREQNTSGRNWKNRGSQITNNQVGWGSENAMRVLNWMIDLCEREGQDGDVTNVQINSQHFTTVIDAVAKSRGGKQGAQECERLINRLISFYEKSGEDHLRPRPECFGAVINAWSKADTEYSSAEHAEAELDRMETYFLREQRDRNFMLSNVAYNLVIDAWSRRSGEDTAERAESILGRMMEKYELTKIKPLRPDVISFTSVIKAYVGHPKGGQKALEMLKEMEQQCREGNVRAKADSKTIAIAIDACVKSGLIDDASRLLDEVEDQHKSAVMFNTLITAFKGRGSEAEALLRKMTHLSNKGYRKCAPDSTTYALCISAWGSTHNATSQHRLERARALFDENIQSFINGNQLLKPSSTHFNTLADVIASSDHPDKELLVLSLFQEMDKFGCSPCIVTFNILLKACASIRGTDERRSKALQIAASAFNSIESAGLKPDSITYMSMIHAILELSATSSDKINALSGIFQRCCADGCMNQLIMNTLVEETSKDEFSAITGGLNRSIQLDELPAQWSRNSRAI